MMFTNMIFLVLALVLISFSYEAGGENFILPAGQAFAAGMALYAATLALIAYQARRKNRRFRKHNLKLFIVNIELLIFLSIYHFAIGAGQLFAHAAFFSALFSLLLFFGGLTLFHLVRGTRPLSEIRMLFPFALPFIFFLGLIDIIDLLWPKGAENEGWDTLALAGSFLFLLSMLILFLPLLIQWIWKCSPLEKGEMKSRLETLCKKTGFRHAGMRTWGIMSHAMTAGIIGIVPRFRYVMFTDRLLNEADPECVEAVLAHEIGHSQRKHLILYPFIVFGMVALVELFSLFFSDTLLTHFILRNKLAPSFIWDIIAPFAIYIPIALIIALYFRYVFGYFSRLFERQADLHPISLGLPPERMIQALDTIATASGNTHKDPSWHHHSIEKRIRFLEQVIAKPELAERHHRKVKWNLIFYFFLLLLSVAMITLMVVPESAALFPPVKKLLEFRMAIFQYFNQDLLEAYVDRFS